MPTGEQIVTKYMVFQEVRPLGAVKSQWVVGNRKSEACLGIIKWYAPWRCWCFFPEPDVVFSADCMEEILKVVRKATEVQ